MRKIVQAFPSMETVAPGSLVSVLVALCDDSTVWALKSEGKWVRLPDIPQEVDNGTVEGGAEG